MNSMTEDNFLNIFQVVIPWNFIYYSYHEERFDIFELITQLSTGMINSFSIKVAKAWWILSTRLEESDNQKLVNVFSTKFAGICTK